MEIKNKTTALEYFEDLIIKTIQCSKFNVHFNIYTTIKKFITFIIFFFFMNSCKVILYTNIINYKKSLKIVNYYRHNI
jgi:hypothetical protein